MSFVAAEPASPKQKVISNTPFWPDVDLNHYLLAMRQDGTVSPERLEEAAINAISEVNAEMEDYKTAQISQGYSALESVPSPKIGGSSEKLYQYRRAVYSLTKANLSERYRDIDATKQGAKRAEDMESTIDDLRRDAQWAMQRLQGKIHMTVELI